MSFRVVSTGPEPPDDVRAFLCRLDRLTEGDAPAIDPSGDIHVARAPGRLDVMGGIADYSGSLVLEMPIREATLCAVQRTARPSLRMESGHAAANDRAARVELPMEELTFGAASTYERARAWFARDPRTHWAAYVAGVLLVLRCERKLALDGGVNLVIDSTVPEGKGVSSSAALEVAVMRAVCAAFGLTPDAAEMAALCQQAENLVAGAPCGIMDQMTSACGEANRLLALLCQPAQIEGQVEIPEGLRFWGIDSGVRHAVGGSDYEAVRTGAFMGYRILADLENMPVIEAAPGGALKIWDSRWNGYLARVAPSEFASRFERALPESMRGDRFLERYGGITDPVTTVDPGRTYPVRTPTAHPVQEHHRVRAFAELLCAPLTERRLEVLGEMMFQSHASYTACGLGSDATDRLVNGVREAGPSRGLYGAKITGGGSGGTVAVLGRDGAAEAVEEIAARYGRETGRAPHVFSGSSPGADSFGTLLLRADG